LKMLRYLKSRNVAVYLVDHFDALDDETAREIVKLGIDGIWLSIDGSTKETYEKVQVGCSFDRVQENIKKVIALKKEYKSPIPELNFRMIVTTENVHEMPRFVHMVHSYGDRNARGDGSHAEFVGLLEYEQIQQYKVPKLPQDIVQETIKAKKETGVELFICHTQPDQHAPLDRCLAWMEPYIMMGGYVLPCCSVLMSNRRQWLREHAFGNVFEKSMKDIWYSDRYKRFRQIVTKNQEKVPLFCYRCRSYQTEDRAAKYGIAEDL
jgi:MoaA/NifB/PqqE/SkfB family radical SAM enzyme